MSLAIDLLDSIALAEAAKESGITIEQARTFAAVLGEMSAMQMCRIVGESCRIRNCGRERVMRRSNDDE